VLSKGFFMPWYCLTEVAPMVSNLVHLHVL